MATAVSFPARLLQWLGRRPAVVRFLVPVLPALLAGGLAPAWLGGPLVRTVAAWDAYALTLLGLSWAAILSAEPHHIRSTATTDDPGRNVLFGLAVAAASASLLAVLLLLHGLSGLPRTTVVVHAALAAGAVAAAWLLVHTLFTLRYAHLYYDPAVGGAEGGLDFPGQSQEPDYLDFAYFAFVIGMTAQTADVSISGRSLRRLALLHGVLAFGFNTAVVAMSVSSLAGAL